jgi:NAD(P)H-dependent FMN reductase
MIGLVGVSGGATGALPALNALRSVGRALHAWVVPEQTAVPHADDVFDDNGNCKDESIEKRLKAVGRQVAKFASLHNSEQAREFLQLWESAAKNPGGEDR